MKEKLSLVGFKRTIWQEDGAKPHQAVMVMNWLDTIFKERMLAIKCIRGDTWAPYSPDCSPCDFFLWGYLKEKVYHPLPVTLEALRRKNTREFTRIPELMVQKAVLNMKKRERLIVEKFKNKSGNRFAVVWFTSTKFVNSCVRLIEVNKLMETLKI